MQITHELVNQASLNSITEFENFLSGYSRKINTNEIETLALSVISSNNINNMEIDFIFYLINKISVTKLKDLFKFITSPVLLTIILNTLHEKSTELDNLKEYEDIVISNINLWNKTQLEKLWYVICDLPLIPRLKQILSPIVEPYFNEFFRIFLTKQHTATFQKNQDTIIKDKLIELFCLSCIENINYNTIKILMFKKNIVKEFLLQLSPDILNNIFREYYKNQASLKLPQDIFIQLFTIVVSSNPKPEILENFFKIIINLDTKQQQEIFYKNALPTLLEKSENLDNLYSSLKNVHNDSSKNDFSYNLLFVIRNFYCNNRDVADLQVRSIKSSEYDLKQIHQDSIYLWLDSYSNFNIKTVFINQLAELIENINLERQFKLLNLIHPTFITKLINYSIENLNNYDLVHADSCKQIISWLSSIHLLDDENNFNKIYYNLGKEDLSLLSSPHIQNIAKTILAQKENSLNELTTAGIWIQRLIIEPAFIADCTIDDYLKLLERYKLLAISLKKEELKNASNAKKMQILAFRIEAPIRELLNNAKINIQKLDNKVALKNLSAIIQSQTHKISDSFWLKIKQSLYGSYFASYGDIVRSKYLIYQWMEKLSDHYNFFQQQLIDKNSSVLYGADGKQLGYIDPRNYFVPKKNTIFEPKNDTDFLKIYNKNNFNIGYVDYNGKIIFTNIFDKDCSLFLLSNTSTLDLRKSLTATDLLIVDVFREEKWIELKNNIKNDTDKIEFFNYRINHIFEKCDNFNQCYMVFRQLYNDDNTQHLLQVFLQKNNLADIIFQIFLEFNNNIPELYSRLQWHYNHANKINIQEPFNIALENLYNTNYQTLENCLISISTNEVLLDHILFDWLVSGNKWFLKFFNQKILLALINTSNSDVEWLSNNKHKLILLILDAYVDLLYTNEQQDPSILKALNIFLSRYFDMQYMLPDLKSLFDKILPVLCVQSALIGLNISNIKSQKYLLYKFEAKYFDNLQSIFDKFLIKLNLQEQFEWKKELVHSWLEHKNQTKTAEIDFLSLFLLNFKGSEENLLWLLKYMLSDHSLNFHPIIINNVSNIMVLLQNKLISNVICEQIERILLLNANLLTSTVYKNIISHKKISELDFIKNLGHNKNYELVIQACNVLAKDIKQKLTWAVKIKKFFGGHKEINETLNLLNNIKKEAATEQTLRKYKNKWFFGILKTFKRFLTYFWREPTGYINLCDTPANKAINLPPSPSQSEIKKIVIRDFKKTNEIYREHLENESPSITSIFKMQPKLPEINSGRDCSLNV